MMQKGLVSSVEDGGMVRDECMRKIEQEIAQNSKSKAKPRLIYSPKFDIVNIIKYFKDLSQPSETSCLMPKLEEELL